MSAAPIKSGLLDRSFTGFLTAAFLNAFIDNAFKIIISFVILREAPGHEGTALAAAAGIFTLPFLLFSSWAGTLADRYSKRDVFVVMQIFSVFAFGLGAYALSTGHLALIFASLFLAGMQAAFVSPAKYGLLAETQSQQQLSRANGITESVNFSAIVLGTAFGGFALAASRGEASLAVIACGILAIAGVAASFRVWSVSPSAPTARINWINPLGETFRELKAAMSEPRLGAPMVGLAFFWFLGAMTQMNVMLFAREELFAGLSADLVESRTGILLTCLALGIGTGSILAGRWSGPKVEIGLVPLGALGIAGFLCDLGFFASSAPRAGADLFALGLSGGLFVVPLQALLQSRAPVHHRGAVLSASNFLIFSAILAASGALPLFEAAGYSARGIFLLLSAATLLLALRLALWLGEFTIRFLMWLATHTIYDITIRGRENFPERGPALLIANHVSFADAVLIGACGQRMIRFVMDRAYFDKPLLKPFCRLMKAIPIAPGESSSSRASLMLAAEELKKGHVVCIFAEGSITRTGNLLAFRKGFEAIAREAHAPLIPVHLDGLWGSIFSFDRGRVFFKRPKQLPYPVTISFGPPAPPDASAHELRQAVSILGSDALSFRLKSESGETLPSAFIRSARRRWWKRAVSDSTGATLSYGRLYSVAVELSHRLANCNEKRIGILLPPGVAGCLANVGASFAGCSTVNLNFTASHEAFRSAVEQSGLRRILTSKKFLEKVPKLDLGGVEILLMEDLIGALPRAGIFARQWCGFFLPAFLLRRALSRPIPGDSEATVIFSSGSTGLPKGAVLSHANIRANIAGLAQVFDVTTSDVILGTLPLFHSFGFTATIWFPLIAGFSAHYHPNPLDPRGVGAAARASRSTIFVTTPTFASTYCKRIAPADFATLRFTMAGAEALRAELVSAWKEKFGSSIHEGYGATECSPVIAANTPARSKPGCVGHPLPGVTIRVVDRESGDDMGVAREGMLEVHGANVMLGYLDDPLRTSEVLREGWYRTGDMAVVDRDGFIRITGRLSRFSKIAGEMVPHGRIEEELLKIVPESSSALAVAGVDDPRHGERLVVLHAIDLNAFEATRRLRESGLPNLWIPRPEDYHRVDVLPVLGSGKLDLKLIHELAAALATRETRPKSLAG
ncbi:MAG: MFS transporter [Candidatus Hydrogenedentota bacterium]